MKRFITLALLTLGLVSCSGCGKKIPDPGTVDAQPVPTATAPADAGPPPVNPLTFKGERWEFTLPGDGWKGMGEGDMGPNTVVLINPTLMGIIVFEEKSFPGTLDVLALNNLRAMRNSGATIVSAKQTPVNGHNFVLVEATKNTNRVWMWMTANGTYAHAFSCGGPETAPGLREVCFTTASTIKLK